MLGAGRVGRRSRAEPTLPSSCLLPATWETLFSSSQPSVQGFLGPEGAASRLCAHVVSPAAPLGAAEGLHGAHGGLVGRVASLVLLRNGKPHCFCQLPKSDLSLKECV